MDDPKTWALDLSPHVSRLEREPGTRSYWFRTASKAIPLVVALTDERDALRAENEDLRASRDMWASARSESISLDLAALRARLEEAERLLRRARGRTDPVAKRFIDEAISAFLAEVYEGTEADARLIAAAPDLAARLAEAESLLAETCERIDLTRTGGVEHRRAVQAFLGDR